MSDDHLLRKRILDELHYDPRVDSSHINVAVTDGAVALSGHVISYPQLFVAGKAAWRVKGVVTLANDLRVELAVSHVRNDSDVAESIAHVLRHNVSLPDSELRAEVRDGVVSISGTVDWEFQRRHVEKQIAHVSGVKAIYNRVKLTPRASALDVKEHIEAALQRNAELEAEHVEVEVDGDEVTLRGRVRAFYERNLVEAACWSSPGVKRVHDHIAVGD